RRLDANTATGSERERLAKLEDTVPFGFILGQPQERLDRNLGQRRGKPGHAAGVWVGRRQFRGCGASHGPRAVQKAPPYGWTSTFPLRFKRLALRAGCAGGPGIGFSGRSFGSPSGAPPSTQSEMTSISSCDKP